MLIYCNMSRKSNVFKKKSITGKKSVLEKSSAPGRKEQLVESLKLPKDMLLGASILTMTEITSCGWKITRELSSIPRSQSYCRQKPDRSLSAEAGWSLIIIPTRT